MHFISAVFFYGFTFKRDRRRDITALGRDWKNDRAAGLFLVHPPGVTEGNLWGDFRIRNGL